jgi:hypothetical protein
MTKREFLQKFVLNKVRAGLNGQSIPTIVEHAVIAWDLVEKNIQKDLFPEEE